MTGGCPGALWATLEDIKAKQNASPKMSANLRRTESMPTPDFRRLGFNRLPFDCSTGFGSPLQPQPTAI